MEADILEKEKEQMEQVLGKLLRYGIFLSVAFLCIGLFLYLVQYHQSQVDIAHLQSFGLMDYIGSHSWFDGGTIMLVGVAFLILTPIFRVVSTFIIFSMSKDKMYVRFTVVVMLIILISIILGFIVEPK